LESRHLESRAKAEPRLGLEVSTGWVSPSSRPVGWRRSAALHRRCWNRNPSLSSRWGSTCAKARVSSVAAARTVLKSARLSERERQRERQRERLTLGQHLCEGACEQRGRRTHGAEVREAERLVTAGHGVRRQHAVRPCATHPNPAWLSRRQTRGRGSFTEARMIGQRKARSGWRKPLTGVSCIMHHASFVHTSLTHHAVSLGDSALHAPAVLCVHQPERQKTALHLPRPLLLRLRRRLPVHRRHSARRHMSEFAVTGFNSKQLGLGFNKTSPQRCFQC
jgi:hypothetical protein